MSIRVERSGYVTCFQKQGVGTQVISEEKFWGVLLEGIKKHDTSKDRAPGQHFVVLEGANELVSAGVGERTLNPEDYVNRVYRDRVEQFLRRTHAATVGLVAAIVYTVDAYLNDPQVKEDEAEYKRISESGCDYVLVAVLAGPSLKVSAFRLLVNVCGGNREWDSPTLERLLEAIRDTKEFEEKFCVVSD